MIHLREEMFNCDCFMFNHSFRISVDREYGVVYLDVMLNPQRRFMRRLLIAFKYLFFPHKLKESMYDEFIVRDEDFKRIRECLTMAERIKEPHRHLSMSECDGMD